MIINAYADIYENNDDVFHIYIYIYIYKIMVTCITMM
jgi:hypothetical protein